MHHDHSPIGKDAIAEDMCEVELDPVLEHYMLVCAYT
jgi:hypothetical protein